MLDRPRTMLNRKILKNYYDRFIIFLIVRIDNLFKQNFIIFRPYRQSNSERESTVSRRRRRISILENL